MVVEVVVVVEEESNDSRFGALTMGVGHAPLSPLMVRLETLSLSLCLTVYTSYTPILAILISYTLIYHRTGRISG